MDGPPDVTITRAAVDAIVAHARTAFPNECCGLLIGTFRRIECAAPARNVAASPTRFLVDPGDHFAAIRQARRAGWEVVGAYHSHPDHPPRPSPTDLAETLPGEDLSLIVSLTADEEVPARLGAYVRRTTGFKDLRLRVE